QQGFECEGAVDEGMVEPGAAAERAPVVAADPPAEEAGAAEPPAATPPPARLGWVPRWLSDPQSHAWRYLSIPIAAAVVIGALILIKGSGDSAQPSSTAPAPSNNASNGGTSKGTVFRDPTFTLTIPSGWHRTEPGQGAQFGAASADGSA